MCFAKKKLRQQNLAKHVFRHKKGFAKKNLPKSFVIFCVTVLLANLRSVSRKKAGSSRGYAAAHGGESAIEREVRTRTPAQRQRIASHFPEGAGQAKRSSSKADAGCRVGWGPVREQSSRIWKTEERKRHIAIFRRLRVGMWNHSASVGRP